MVRLVFIRSPRFELVFGLSSARSFLPFGKVEKYDRMCESGDQILTWRSCFCLLPAVWTGLFEFLTFTLLNSSLSCFFISLILTRGNQKVIRGESFCQMEKDRVCLALGSEDRAQTSLPFHTQALPPVRGQHSKNACLCNFWELSVC